MLAHSMLSANADVLIEPGDYDKCVRCDLTIQPGDDRKPGHSRRRDRRDAPMGFRHKCCPRGAKQAAHRAAADRQAQQVERRKARRAPYTRGGDVTTVDLSSGEVRATVSSYARKAITRLTHQGDGM